MDDDWSEEEIEEGNESSEVVQQENHIEDHPMPPVAPHLLESAALRHIHQDKPEETVIVSKNERFADVTYDRRENSSPDDIHGQPKIYNAKLGRFEPVQHQHHPTRDSDRGGRRNVEIMQRNGGRRESSTSHRRDSFAKNEENRRPFFEQLAHSPPVQRRSSIAERDPNVSFYHPRRDSFVSTSAVSDADRSVSNASPTLDGKNVADLSPTEIFALQQQQMAASRERAKERRRKEEEERAAGVDRARKKAAELAAMASSESTASKTDSPKVSPIPAKAFPLPPKVSPLSSNVSPAPPPPVKPSVS